jgi:hypothetical protein
MAINFRKTWGGDLVSECGRFRVTYPPISSVLAKAGDSFKWFRVNDSGAVGATAAAIRWLNKQATA